MTVLLIALALLAALAAVSIRSAFVASAANARTELAADRAETAARNTMHAANIAARWNG